MKATYNLPTDKLKAWFDDRLSKDNYDRMRRAGFIFCHGQKCFMAKWSPQAEDLVKELGIPEIEADDSPDDVEARVNRFAGYAESAEQSAESAQNYLDERANTERRRKNAVNAIEKNLSAAEHWQQRIDGAIRHAARKERPDVIARRIEGLEKSRRKFVADSTPDPRVDGARYGSPDCSWVGPKGGRGGHWVKNSELPAIQVWAQRWIEHIDRRLQYERALLEAAGGIVGGTGAAPMDRERFQVGGAIKGGLRGGEWRIITKVNKRTVEVFEPSCRWRNLWKVDRTEIKDVASADDVKSAPEHSELWHAQYRRKAMLKEQEEIARIEKDHADELEKFCQARGWGRYTHQGRDSKICLIRDWLKGRSEVAA